MSHEERQAALLAEWLASEADAPPAELDRDVVESIYALRPDRAPAPRLLAEDILSGITAGPLAQAPAAAEAPLGDQSGAEVVSLASQRTSRRWTRTLLGGGTVSGLALAAVALFSLRLATDNAMEAPIMQTEAPAVAESMPEPPPPPPADTPTATGSAKPRKTDTQTASPRPRPAPRPAPRPLASAGEGAPAPVALGSDLGAGGAAAPAATRSAPSAPAEFADIPEVEEAPAVADLDGMDMAENTAVRDAFDDLDFEAPLKEEADEAATEDIAEEKQEATRSGDRRKRAAARTDQEAPSALAPPPAASPVAAPLPAPVDAGALDTLRARARALQLEDQAGGGSAFGSAREAASPAEEAQRLLTGGDPQGAIALINAALPNTPETATRRSLYIVLGDAHRATGNLQAATEAYEKAIAL